MDPIGFTEEVVRLSVSRFVSKADSESQLERLILSYSEDIRTEDPNLYRHLHQIIHTMGKAREQYTLTCSSAAAVKTTLVSKAFETIETIMTVIGRKRHRILLQAALMVTSENPNFRRSHHFTDDALIRLAVCKSFVDPGLLAKWKRLHCHVKVVGTRLTLLQVTLANITDLLVNASDYESDTTTLSSMHKKNELAAARMHSS